MKFKTTRKAIVNGTNPHLLFRCGFCDMHYLLRNHSPIAYTCGVYGWNFDVYSVHDIVITTGYRNMCGKPIKWEFLREYERKAKSVFDDYSVPYDVRMEQIESVLIEFIQKLKGEK